MPPECPEQVQAQQIIIIHPGSFNLRIGRASDLNPHRILHAVARRRKPGATAYSDPFLPPSVTKVNPKAFERCDQ
ncbi:Actin-related protein 8 [Pseudolycoriella hygida]|uniref:Actin-related protein 8 n=1 Tax=Pseudolycoriella hygida TaxID=35572 RepID=A0A9Q0RXM3_9DIPT|nr:Actin-related protein 8 [Pseudolycoriella hygida]